MSLKQRIPWWGKIAAKIILSRTPIGYGFWRRIGLFVHGKMNAPEYAYRVVMSHLDRLGWVDLCDKVVLELGPGDGLLTALITRALGARRTYLSDVGDFASHDVSQYRQAAEFLRGKGLQPPDINECANVSDVLSVCNAEYMRRGLQDLRRIPAISVDLVFSQAVLEHVRLHELLDTLVETQRVLAPTGVSSHDVDLKDHLAGGLNNLRFPSRVWESRFMADSGFYTNRVRFNEMLEMFRRAGFTPEVVEAKRWRVLPISRGKLSDQYRALPDEDLLVSEFGVVARRDAVHDRGPMDSPL